MNPLEAVIFDLDGTLVDSKPGIVAGLQRAFETHGLPPPHGDEIEIGAPLLDLVRDLLKKHGQEKHADIVASFRADYNTTGMYLAAPFAGVPKLLANLNHESLGLRVYIATAKAEVYAKPMVRELKFDSFFRRVYGAELNGARTNKVELLAHLLEQEQLSGDACVMIGDRSFDMKGAKANGAMAIGVSWGYGTAEELRTHGADALVADTDELLRVIHERAKATRLTG